MAAEPGGSQPAPRRVRNWARKLGFHQMWQIGVVVVLAATAAFGGLDTVNTKVTPMTAGEPFHDGEFAITIQRATAVRELRANGTLVGPPAPGYYYLGVVAAVRNDGSVPGQLRNEIDLHGLPDSQFLDTFRMSDGSQLSALGPGLTETVAFVWKVPEKGLQANSKTVTLRVWHKKYTEYSVNYGKGWIESLDQYGEVELPVKVAP
ncbi:MAG TPA: hypothetical protein VH496_09855 [Mycobacterium sp.]|jgi:hypothetical protein